MLSMTRLDRRTEAILGFSLTALYDQVQADEPLFGAAAAVHPAHAALCEAEADATAQHLALMRLASRPGRVDEDQLDRLDEALARLEAAVDRRDRQEGRLARLLDTVARPASDRSPAPTATTRRERP
ncbi:hypothetical protein [Streptacidiphilus neutrinimicus]|uniref:hypothetical protein n=1 Tax=Streptacidiphilus neutrinimicus TaxID=105420 RepID=UPI0005A66267|nr:hypothetical protein [Streptacidiphilus neutrinimicus]